MMKYLNFLLLTCLLFAGCDSDDGRLDNPYLSGAPVNLEINLRLPQYTPVLNPANPVFIPNQGNVGIVVMNTGTNTYVAFDASDPNHPISSDCYAMQLEGTRLVCDCEQNTYELFTGNFISGENLRFPLYAYRISKIDNNTLVVTN